MKETITIEGTEHAQDSNITVTVVENGSKTVMNEPAKLEVEVKIEQLPNSFDQTSETVEVRVSESPEITVIKEQPSQTNVEIEPTTSDDQNNVSEMILTEEDQEKLQDIYEDLFKGAALAQEEEEKEKQEDQEQEEDKEGGKRCRQCHCDCDTLLRAVKCNFKVIGSKFCICGRRRRRQQTATQQPANISATNPSVMEPLPKQETTNEDYEPKAEEPIAKALMVEDFMTPTMQRARKQGWSYYGKFTFPLVSDVVRDIWVFGELCLLVLSFILSLVSFCTRCQQQKRVQHFPSYPHNYCFNISPY